jgi:hypothetical protein
MRVCVGNTAMRSEAGHGVDRHAFADATGKPNQFPPPSEVVPPPNAECPDVDGLKQTLGGLSQGAKDQAESGHSQ